MKFKKAAGLILAGFIALNSTVMSASATQTHSCDVNNDGSTTIADVLLMTQLLNGWATISDFDEADYDNDGFVTQVDIQRVQYYLAGITQNINPDDTTGSDTSPLNTTVSYRRYNATTGSLLETYSVAAFPEADELTEITDLNAGTGNSPMAVIGNDTRYEDYSHSGVCKIVTNKGWGTGFVASNNTILTAGHVVVGSRILSITFYDEDGTVTHTSTPVNYSIPTGYSSSTYTDYALIKVSDNLSDYKSFSMGFALDRAISETADVSVTGFSTGFDYELTGEGRLTTGDEDFGEIYYTADTAPGTSGSPIYTDVVYNNTHHYVVVGIHTSRDTNDPAQYNCGVRMCPNILHLISANN